MNSTSYTINRGATYKAARIVSKSVETHFAQHLAAQSKNKELMQIDAPSAHLIEAIIDAAFWASLRKEEGHSPKISLALLPPSHAGQPLIFEQRLPLIPAVITKIAPGVERAGIHVGVWHENDELYVWGTTSEISSLCFVLDVSEPGLLVIKHRHAEGFGKFVNVAVLIGDQVKIIDEGSANLPDCPALLTSLLGISTPSSWHDSVNLLVQLAVSMRAHSRGGSLLVVPSGTETWRKSIMQPMQYAVAPAFSGLAELINAEVPDQGQDLWESSLRKEVDRLAGLTSIDGATIITDSYELLAFGAKIIRADGQASVDQIMLTEPVIGGSAEIVNPAQSGGTRHLSAAQFVHDQRNAMALVASQDGKFTVFAWSPCEGMVHAHRIDTLLL